MSHVYRITGKFGGSFNSANLTVDRQIKTVDGNVSALVATPETPNSNGSFAKYIILTKFPRYTCLSLFGWSEYVTSTAKVKYKVPPGVCSSNRSI